MRRTFQQLEEYIGGKECNFTVHTRVNGARNQGKNACLWLASIRSLTYSPTFACTVTAVKFNMMI